MKMINDLAQFKHIQKVDTIERGMGSLVKD